MPDQLGAAHERSAGPTDAAGGPPAPHALALPAPDEHETATALTVLRPDLVAAYRAVLPGARAAVLGRLWGALAREPIDGIVARRTDRDRLVVTLTDGRELRGPDAASRPFAVPADDLTLELDGAARTDPAELIAALRLPGAAGRHAGRLATELANSVANLALARAAQPALGVADQTDGRRPDGRRAGPRPDDDRPDGDRPDLADLEQSVVDGHPLHPGCRARVGLSTEDVLRFAPEHRPVVHLVEVAVPAERWHTTGTAVAPLLPVHPWQLPRLRRAGLGEPTGATIAARPLMSLRTLAPLHDRRFHLKTSVDVQMTSAIRTVSPAAVHNGPVLSGLIAGLTRRTPGLTVLREPTAGAILVDGVPSRHFAAVWREAPRLAAGETALPLAAYPAVDHDGPRSAVDAFGALVHLLLPPLLTLLHLGVALEAHGQNTLVVLHAGRPARILYRDLGGVRISPRRLARAGIDPPSLHGDVVEDDPRALRTKLFAAVVSTVVAEVVTVLVRRYRVAAEPLWDRVAEAARSAYAALPLEARGDADALFGDRLPVKAMTAMRLADDAIDDIWATVPNPMAGLR